MISRRLLLTFAAGTLSLLAADSSLLRLIPQDSAFVAGIHANQIRESRFGQFLLDQLKSEEASMDQFISATGFDPRRDLSELIVASNDVHGRGKGNALVAARGRFDMGRISQFTRTHGANITTVQGVEVLTGRGEHNSEGWLAILDSTTAVAGNAETVRSAIDRYKRNAPAAIDAKTAARISDLSGRYDAWMISTSLGRLADDFRDPQVGGAMRANLMQAMQSVQGGVRFGASIEVMLEASMRSEKDATAMVDVVRFLAGMMQLQGDKDKKAAEMMSLIDKLELNASGTEFRMSMRIPEDMIERLVKPASRKGPVI